LDPSKILEYGSFVVAIPPCVVACIQIWSRATRERTIATLLFAALAVLMSIGLGMWMLLHPLKPTIIVKEIAIPCPPSRTGAAITHGSESPATSGNGDSVTYGGPPAPQKSPK
jgi:hypothetical protein